MKRFIYAIIILAVVLSTFQLWAAQSDGSEKPSTLVILKNDVVSPEKGDDIVCQNLFIYWKKGVLGGGVETNFTAKTNYLQLKPIVTYEVIKGVSMVAGAATDSVGKDFADVGVWFNTNIGEAKLFVDIRNYWGLNAKSSDYTDNFLEVTYPAGEKFTLGVNAAYDRWWKTGNEWILAGPVIYYKASKEVTIFTRVSQEWSMAEKTSTADRYRIGIKFFF